MSNKESSEVEGDRLIPGLLPTWQKRLLYLLGRWPAFNRAFHGFLIDGSTQQCHEQSMLAADKLYRSDAVKMPCIYAS